MVLNRPDAFSWFFPGEPDHHGVAVFQPENGRLVLGGRIDFEKAFHGGPDRSHARDFDFGSRRLTVDRQERGRTVRLFQQIAGHQPAAVAGEKDGRSVVIAHVLNAAILVVVMPEAAAFLVAEQAIRAQRTQFPQPVEVEIQATRKRLGNPGPRKELLQRVIPRRSVAERVAALRNKLSSRVVNSALKSTRRPFGFLRSSGNPTLERTRTDSIRSSERTKSPARRRARFLTFPSLAESLPPLPKKLESKPQGQPSRAALQPARLEIVQHVAHLDLATRAAIADSIEFLQLAEGGLRRRLEHFQQSPAGRLAACADNGFRRTATGIGTKQVSQHVYFSAISSRPRWRRKPECASRPASLGREMTPNGAST